MSNPKLAVEFAAIGEKDVVASIDRVAGAGERYIDKWTEHNRSSASEYTRFWKQALAYQDRQIQDHFQESARQRSADVADAKAKAREASDAVIAEKKRETALLIAEGKRVISAQRQTQLAMESRVANAGGYGPKLSTTQYGPSIDLKRAHDFQIAEEKRLTRELERENLQRERGESAHQREMARIAKTNRAQLNLENKVANAGGYGPQRPIATVAPVAPERMASTLNVGMVNAAAFLNVATSAYYMASKAVAVVGSFVMDAAKWEAMTLALENMEGGASAASGAIERLYEIAKAPGIDLETAQHAYLKLRAVSIQGSEAERIIKGFSNTVARGGGGSVQFGRVLEQFTQMRAENRVLQQDLKFMKNSMPELASIMERVFGTTTAEGIRKLGLNAREFTAGILTEMEKLPKAQQTLQSELENTGVAWSRLKASMVDTEWTKEFLASWTDVFEQVTTLIKAKSVDWAGMIRAAMNGDVGRVDKFKLESSDDYTQKALRDAPRLYAKKQYDELSAVEKIKANLSRKTDYIGANDFGFSRSEMTLKEFDPSKKLKSGPSYNEYVRLLQSQSSAFSEKDKGYITALQPNLAADDDKTDSSGKKKSDPIGDARKRLAEQLRLRQMQVNAEKAYNDNMEKMLSEGVDKREAEIVAEGIKAVAAKRKEYEALEKDAYGDAKLLAEIEKQKNEAVRAVRVKYNADRNAMSEKIRQEDETREAQDRIKAVQSEIDKAEARKKTILENEKKLQAEIDKYTAGEALSAETNQLLAIENEYKLHYERIKNAKFESEVEKARVTEEFQNKEKAAIRDFYAQQYSIAVSGASDMFGALAELRKNGTSEANDTYQVLFGISKAFAIADATIKLSSAAINAMAVGSSQGIPVMLANIGTTMAMGGGLISQINATAYSGAFDKGGNIPVGKWGIAGENGPEIIQGPAHVTSTRDTARLVGAGGGTKVVVNNYSGASVSTKTNSNGEMEILIQRAAEVAEDRISAGIASGGGKVSQQLTRTFGVKR